MNVSSVAAAGGARAGEVRIAAVSDRELDPVQHLNAVRSSRAGGEVLFCGVVRDHDDGRPVLELEYTHYPTAADILHEVASEFAGHPEVVAVALSHRVGVLRVGDVALVAAVSCAHRDVAFAECARMVDEVKARLPIWKRQVFGDGTDEWVNSP